MTSLADVSVHRYSPDCEKQIGINHGVAIRSILNSLSYLLLLVVTAVLSASEAHNFSKLNMLQSLKMRRWQQAKFLETDPDMRLPLDGLRAVEGAYGHGLAQAHGQYREPLINVCEAVSAKQKSAKMRSL